MSRVIRLKMDFYDLCQGPERKTRAGLHLSDHIQGGALKLALFNIPIKASNGPGNSFRIRYSIEKMAFYRMYFFGDVHPSFFKRQLTHYSDVSFGFEEGGKINLGLVVRLFPSPQTSQASQTPEKESVFSILLLLLRRQRDKCCEGNRVKGARPRFPFLDQSDPERLFLNHFEEVL
jgi:hypothetical protein